VTRKVPRPTPATAAPLLAIRSEAEYDAAYRRLTTLLDAVGDNPHDPRYRIMETLSVLIRTYDQEHPRLPDASGVEVVRFLMAQHGLTQSEVPEIGSQGVVSEVLRGRRALNVRHIQALAARFGVPLSVFLTAGK
jgi:HTH-type transcriptional regulator / antitoxin HigA